MPPKRVVTVGAGIYGLIAAKSYIQINPNINLTLIDANSTIGGVWSASRVYPSLKVDSPSPSFEFSDLQIEDEFGIPKWSDLTGEVMAEYLQRYAQKFNILQHCRLNTKVTKIERDGKGWKISMRPSGAALVKIEETITCDVLIMATGSFSTPNLPDIDTSAFTGLIIHSRDFRDRQPSRGNKSAVEVATTCALAGKKVHWLIREDGAGPTVLANAKTPDGQSGFKPVVCRWAQFNIPTIYRRRGAWDWFFSSGKSAIGNGLREWFWNFMTKRIIGDRYEKSEGGKVLKPDICNVFWTASGLSIAHDAEDRLFDIIDRGDLVKPARLTIVSVQDRTFTLSDGSDVEADAVFFATGWLPSSNPLLSPELQAELGFPTAHSSLSATETSYWNKLDNTADQEVLSMYPMLASPPPGLLNRKHDSTQRRQLRTIIPTTLASKGDRSFILLGQLVNTQHFYFAEVSALWAIAYLENLHMKDRFTGNKEGMDTEVALHNAFMRRRYPGRRNDSFAVLEIRDWMDVMLKDLGIREDRNRLQWERRNAGKWTAFGWKPWVEEWFTPYVPASYNGIVDELLERVGSQKERSSSM